MKPSVEEDHDEPVEETSEERRSLAIVSVATLLIVILVFGIIGWNLRKAPEDPYSSVVDEILKKGETKEGYLYNGYVFVNTTGLWNTHWQKGDKEYSINFHVSLIGSQCPY